MQPHLELRAVLDDKALHEAMAAHPHWSVEDAALQRQVQAPSFLSGINLVVQVSRLSDGTRKIMQVSEIVGMEGDIITMQDIFLYEREGMDEKERVLGRFKDDPAWPKPVWGQALPIRFEPADAAREVETWRTALSPYGG